MMLKVFSSLNDSMILYLRSERWYFWEKTFCKQVSTLLICLTLLTRYCMVPKVSVFFDSFFLLSSYFCCFSWLTSKSLVAKLCSFKIECISLYWEETLRQ